MKPSAFEYYAPATRAEALALLAEHGDAAKVLAGGQSLVPTMNFRLAQPGILVDLNGVADLFGIMDAPDGGLQIAAMTRQRTLERSPQIAARVPLLAEALPHIAHPQIRNRGTLGGSLAHNDPAAELPALMVALEAQLCAQSPAGERWIAAADFFQGLFTTALEPHELLTAIRIPAPPPRTGMAFAEVARRHGDYAMAGAAAVVTLAADGTVAAARLIYLAIGDGPVPAPSITAALHGATPTAEATAAAAAAVDADLDPPTDIHATAAYRRHLTRVLARQTLTLAVARAQAG
ncbi:MAG: xanthine dehydrogenase family protein subunit M [Chloroflexota bacterium]|nr:xanthine dehydrogenase family protein subunit M [Chloroflexota bacterium]